jgi:ATP-dependent 26S proteasome regulatory subunit
VLFQQIQLGNPAIWVKTTDSSRLEEFVTSFNKRQYFTIGSSGFSKFVDGKWKPVLVTIPNPNDPGTTIPVTTTDLSVAFDYLLHSKETENMAITFICNVIGATQGFEQQFGHLIADLHTQYRKAFFADDTNKMPLQLLVFSALDVPESFAHYFYVHEDICPTQQELIDIIHHIHTSTNGEVIKIEKAREIANAGLGLTESKFINLALVSILEKGTVDPTYIYESKMANIKKNGILEIIKPKTTFDNIGGLDNIKEVITKNLYFWNNPQEAEKFGIQPIRRILTVGIPGTGKSAICEATANALSLDLARTGVSQVMNSFVGQSEQNMRAVFAQIKAMAPLCVWIDEFGRDMSGGQSSSHVDGGTTDRVHGEFLTGLQELPDNVFLMCAANQLNHLKPEMLRAERFDKIFFVGLPSFEERVEIIKIYLPEGRHDYEAIANSTKYFTGAEIKSLIKEVKFNIVSTHHRDVETVDIVKHAPKVRNILWNKERDMIKDLYRYAYENWDWASSFQYNEIDDILGISKPASNKATWSLKA